MPFFTIIIPTYNRVHVLDKTILSTINQSFTDWECIVVDDGSTDNTQELVSHIAKKEPRIKYIYQENAERSAARNKGIENAKGQYICFLDSDDLYTANNLQDWFQFLEKNEFPKCFAYCDYKINIDGEIEIKKLEKKIITTETSFYLQNPIVPARVCIHKDLLKNHKFELNTIICEDICLWMTLSSGYGSLYSSHIGAEYTIHGDNSVNPKNPSALKMYKGLNYFFNKYPEIKSKIPKSDYNSYLSKIQTNIAKYYYRNGMKIKAIIELIKAIIRAPIHEHTKYRIRLIVLTLFSNNPNLHE